MRAWSSLIPSCPWAWPPLCAWLWLLAWPWRPLSHDARPSRLWVSLRAWPRALLRASEQPLAPHLRFGRERRASVSSSRPANGSTSQPQAARSSAARDAAGRKARARWFALASRLPDSGWPCPDFRSRPYPRAKLSDSRHRAWLAARGTLWSCACRATRLRSPSFSLPSAWKKAPSATHLPAFAAAPHSRNFADAARAPCRRGARAASGSTRYARDRCPSAARACGPRRLLRPCLSFYACPRELCSGNAAPFRAAGADLRAPQKLHRRVRPVRPSCLRDFSRPRLACSSRYFAFLALRIKMYAPVGPGTAPRTSIKFSSVSILITFKFFEVSRSLPMCPGKCCPFQTRDGNELAPMPPGAR